MGGTGDYRWYGDDEEGWEQSVADSPREDGRQDNDRLVVKKWDGWRVVEPRKNKENKGTMNIDDLPEHEQPQRITGKDFAGTVASAEQLIAAAVHLFNEISPSEYTLKNLTSFEQVLIGTYVRKFHLMKMKQQKYGPNNVLAAGVDGILTRWNDKLERAKTMVGTPKKQVDDLRQLRDSLPDDATAQEMAEYIRAQDSILFPEDDPTGEESLEDTLLDGSNYPEMAYQLRVGAWGKDMES